MRGLAAAVVRTLTGEVPRSRNRTPRNRSARQRQRAKQQHTHQRRRLVATLRPGQSLDHLLTPDDLRLMKEALDAEARGDALTAWECHVSGLLVEESLTHHRLHELALIGEDAPAWMLSRWAADQAGRWMLVNEDPRCDEIVRLVLCTLHWSELHSLLGDAVALKEYGTLVAACDWVYRQLATYECGGLRDFLDVRAERGLLDRLDQIDEWERCAVTAYELVGTHDDVLEVRRLPDGQVLELLNLGATTDMGLGATVVGRVVPISVWPFLMFESRPLPVDAQTAQAVGERMTGEDDLGWVWALADAHDEGRLPARATGERGTLWSTDIVPMRTPVRSPSVESAGRVQELVAAGVPKRVADGVCVVEVGLIVAEVSGDVGPIASHVTAVLMDPRVHDALIKHGVVEGHGRLWRILAAATPSPVRERCLELAVLSEQRQAS